MGAELLDAAQGEPVQAIVIVLWVHVRPFAEVQVQTVGGGADGRTPIVTLDAYAGERTISVVPKAGADEWNCRYK